MDKQPRSMYLHELTWPEVKELLPQIRLAIIPVGSTEQHGPHGCFDYDAAGSREFSKRLAQRLYPHVLVAPGIQIGVSGHHIHFPGSITLRPSTLIDVIMDVAWSLHQHGIRKFFIANGHGGNTPSIGVAANRIKQEYGDEVAWATVPYDAVRDVSAKHAKTEVNGHSCEIETSCMLYMWPQSVRQDRLTKGEVRPEVIEASKRGPALAQEARYFDEVTINGALGDATLATAEIGRDMVETALDRYAEYLKDFMNR
ncbi:MAG: creatininase family protein [Bacillota bacterium]|nr:creatininase family protein [Bacillota bacterium]